MGRMHVKRMVFVKKKKISGILGTLLVLVIAGFQLFTQTGDSDKSSETRDNQTTTSQKSAGNTTTEEIPTLAELSKQSVAKPVTEVDLNNPPRFEKIAVDNIRSVDGDTFVFYAENKEYRLRLLMVDTPESVKKDMPVQPYGKEASNFTKTALAKGNVSLAFDEGAVKDKYDRYLAYVFIGDDLLQNELIEEGLGVVRYLNPGNDTYQSDLEAVQAQAEQAKKGAWSKSGYIKETKRYAYFDYE